MATLHGAKCPLCGGNTFVGSLDMFGTNTAVLVCENPKCGQKSLWKLERHMWRLIAPYRYTQQLVTKLEKPKPQPKEEEIKLVFA